LAPTWRTGLGRFLGVVVEWRGAEGLVWLIEWVEDRGRVEPSFGRPLSAVPGLHCWLKLVKHHLLTSSVSRATIEEVNDARFL